jgi:hypothetical protein
MVYDSFGSAAHKFLITSQYARLSNSYTASSRQMQFHHWWFFCYPWYANGSASWPQYVLQPMSAHNVHHQHSSALLRIFLPIPKISSGSQNEAVKALNWYSSELSPSNLTNGPHPCYSSRCMLKYVGAMLNARELSTQHLEDNKNKQVI